MEFCPKCNGLMVPQKSGKKLILICRNCNKKKKVDNEEEFKIKKTTKKDPMKEVVIIDKEQELETLPKTKVHCPKCDHNEAYWWVQQTRSGDEAPTRFLQCTKCNYTWREYD